MAKLVTCNTGSQFFTLSNSLYGALSNVCVVHFGSVSNTNLELLVAQYLASGLRYSADQRLSEGAKGTAGLTISYLEGNVKANSE